MPIYQLKNIGKDLRHFKIILLLPEFGSLTLNLRTGFTNVHQGTHCVLNFSSENTKKLYSKMQGLRARATTDLDLDRDMKAPQCMYLIG